MLFVHRFIDPFSLYWYLCCVDVITCQHSVSSGLSRDLFLYILELFFNLKVEESQMIVMFSDSQYFNTAYAI